MADLLIAVGAALFGLAFIGSGLWLFAREGLVGLVVGGIGIAVLAWARDEWHRVSDQRAAVRRAGGKS